MGFGRRLLRLGAPRLAFASLAVLASGVRGQVPEAESAHFAGVAWHVLPDGVLGITPNPSTGGGGDPLRLFGPLVGDFDSLSGRVAQVALRHPATWLVLLAPGRTDGASTTLADMHLAHRGAVGADAVLAVMRGDREGLGKGGFQAGDPRLDRLLALRAVSRSGLRLGREPAEQVANDPAAPAWLAAAARETAATLGGIPLPAPKSLEPAPLRDRLAALPADAKLVVHVDNRRVPPTHAVIAAARRWYARAVQAEIRMAGGMITPSTKAGAQMLIDWPCLLGYELARRFDNWRVDRAVVGIAGGRRNARCAAWLDGAFSIDGVADGLSAEKVAFERDGGALSSGALGGEVEVRVTPKSLGIGTDLGSDAGARADEWLAAGGDAPIWIVHRRVAARPGLRLGSQLDWLDSLPPSALRIALEPTLQIDLRADIAEGQRTACAAWLEELRAWHVANGLEGELRAELAPDALTLRWRAVGGGTALAAAVALIDAAPAEW